MVRWVSAPWLLAVLGLAGLALAQEGLIVDPWRHPSATPSNEVSKSAPADRSAARPVGVASFPIDSPKGGPSVVPVGPPLDLKSNGGAVVPLGTASDDVVDPWATGSLHPSVAERRARLAVARHDWAWEVQEIVDPWSQGPIAVARDPLIVDPWAR
jgi:hypothetical protein